MCVTFVPAQTGVTSVYTYRTNAGDVTAYQNSAVNLGPTPNCMLLHYPAIDGLELLKGPHLTRTLMADVTDQLPELQPHGRTRGLTFGAESSRGATVEEYGDYHVVLAKSADDLLTVLDEVPPSRRPVVTRSLVELVDWYQATFPGWAFVLACFDQSINPEHPIVVRYQPQDQDTLFAPGLEAHDGSAPLVGGPGNRRFKVAFALDGHELSLKVDHQGITNRRWAPSSVSGFYDNRPGMNRDYVVRVDDLLDGKHGAELARELVAA